MVASSTEITQAAVTYRTEQGTYVALRANNDGNTVLCGFPHYPNRIRLPSPMRMECGTGATAAAGRHLSPLLMESDNMIVWVVGTEDPS